MEITTEQLKIQPEAIISEVNKGQEVTIIWQGRPSAKIISLFNGKNTNIEDADELFGIWKNREDIDNVEQYIRNMRKGRKL